MSLTTNRDDKCIYEIGPDGMQECYLILPDGARQKLIRPIRLSYKHLKCGTVTTMARKLGETYAADPSFYSGTYCAGCKSHFPVGEHGEFIWEDDGTKVGT